MKYKWFWITLTTWVILGTIFSCWAFIYSPLKLDWREKVQFNGSLNGFKESNTVDIVSGALADCLEQTKKQWEIEGWKPMTGGLNLAPLLLGLSSDHNLLSPYLYVGIFQKKDYYRVLSFYNDYRLNQTYRLVSEIPQKAFNPKEILNHWNFPLKPPVEAFSPYCGEFKKFGIALWFLPFDKNSQDHFQAFCSDQGFDYRLWKTEDKEKIFTLRKGNIRLIAVLNTEDKKNVISMVRLDSK